MAAVQMENTEKKGTDAIISGLPRLLEGELIVSSCEKVLKYSIMGKQGSGVMGSLHVTNFKLAFTNTIGLSGTSSSRRMSQSVRSNDLFSSDALSTNDYIPLTCIHRLMVVSTSKSKKKVLTGNKVPSAKYDTLEILCKDFRIIQFDTSLCNDKARKGFMEALIHHAFIHTISRLFAFDYNDQRSFKAEKTPKRAFHTFNHSKDFELLLTTQGALGCWRVSKFNRNYSICKSLPELNVVPHVLSDEDLVSLALSFQESRLPTWEWSDTKHGASLLTSAFIKPSQSSSHTAFYDKWIGYPERLLRSLENCCSGLDNTPPVEIVSMSSYFPTIQELQHGFTQLRKACYCHSSEDFWSSDNSWLSRIESSKWIEYIQICFQCTQDVIKYITEENKTVILEEPQGRDFCCLVSSLVQIALDPFFRTILGIQSLIQKSWVSKGHKFLDRLAHLHSLKHKKIKSVKAEENGMNSEESLLNEEESPLFLLFINCLHNMVVQHPTLFEYNENFLCMLTDSLYTCMFETFLFNSDYQRNQVTQETPLVSLWAYLSNNIHPVLFQKTFVNPLVKVSALETEYVVLKEKAANFKLDGYKLEDRDFTNKICTDTVLQIARPGLPVNSLSSCSSMLLEKQYILPEIQIIHNDFWHGYFLRWLPKFDLVEDGDVALCKQQKVMIEEIEYLEDRLSRLYTIQSTLEENDLSHSQRSLSWRKKNKVCGLKGDLDSLIVRSKFSFFDMLHDKNVK